MVNVSETHTVGQRCGRDPAPAPTTSQHQRFPGDISSHAVWLYLRFGVSFREVEERVGERGVVVP